MAVLSSSTASDAQWQPFANTDDPESLSLVATFLEDDLRFAQDAQVAQALQLELALGIGRSASPTTSFDALPAGERDPEDIALYELARQQKWSRCPGCRAMIELVQGCHHMSCLRTPINNPATPQTAGQAELDREHKLELLDFVLADYDPGPFSRPFTGFFLSALVCGYCHEAFETRQALQQHLADAPHPVNTCCGRFFRARLHLQQHQRRSDGPHRSLVTGV
ncbi:hypothetical protein JCM5296_005512 [Sporobolomyces johnsonii]